MKHLPNMNFLRYFYSAGTHGSISKAAAENFVTQSAVSQGIDKLELELGKKLVSNRKNRFELTADGKLLLEKCSSILSIFSDIADLFNEKEGVYKGKLSFAMSHSMAIALLPSYYQKLFCLHPDVEPVLRLGHSGVIRNWVSSGEVDFGIIMAKEGDADNFNTLPILQGHYRLYKGPKGANDRLIISEDSNEDHKILQHLKASGQKIPPTVAVLSWEVIANMVQQGLGIGILPDYVAKQHKLKAAQIKFPTIPYTIIAIWSDKKDLPRNAKMFVELIRK